jgi:pyrroloquinoline quinone biosynthesis protein B
MRTASSSKRSAGSLRVLCVSCDANTLVDDKSLLSAERGLSTHARQIVRRVSYRTPPACVRWLLESTERELNANVPFLVVLGTAQDAGYPQPGCRRPCCRRAWTEPARRRRPACLAIVDPESRERWLVECTPDFREQLHHLDTVAPPREGSIIEGIFLTHAHIGHYTGLMFLGREAMATERVPVHAMPRMRRFLENHGPWNQLVSDGNIDIRELEEHRGIRLNNRLRVTPLTVPHRDDYSETVGFRIQGPDRTALFLPDIDAWDAWDTTIETLLSEVDLALLDGTFYSAGELPGRDMATIPHPPIVESMKRFAPLPTRERNKVRFIHFNHSNPVLDPQSPETDKVRDAGHQLAMEGERHEL